MNTGVTAATGSKTRRRLGAGAFLACLLGAGVLGGGAVAGVTAGLSNSAGAESAPAQTAQYTP